MKTSTTLATVSMPEAKARLEELFAEASEEPVEIAAPDGRTAYLVSKQDFDSMLATVEELTDQVWLLRAELARKGGIVSEEEMKTITAKLESVGHAEADTRQRG
jgi:PHD/YefM family antitoxin component YafN of YafNO toxin-antitoxin module